MQKTLEANRAAQLLPKLPSTVDPKTITLSNQPNGGDSKKIGEIAKYKLGQIGLRYFLLFYMASGGS